MSHNFGRNPLCKCKICAHNRGVVTPLHPAAFVHFAKQHNRELQARRDAEKAAVMRRLMGR